MILTLENTIKNSPCWSDEHATWWFTHNDLLEGIDSIEMLEHPHLSSVEKAWGAFNLGILPDEDYHWLAIDFAQHVIKAQHRDCLTALAIKASWIRGNTNDETLKVAENWAWEEASESRETISPPAAAAFACKTDPIIAAQGAATRAGGLLDGDVNWEEKEWQLERIKFYARRADNEV